MMRVQWTDRATCDLRELELYLKSTGMIDVQAVVDRIVLATYWLLEHPGGGPRTGRAPRRKWTPPGQRHAVIIYKPVRDGIAVLRIRHARSNWRKGP